MPGLLCALTNLDPSSSSPLFFSYSLHFIAFNIRRPSLGPTCAFVFPWVNPLCQSRIPPPIEIPSLVTAALTRLFNYRCPPVPLLPGSKMPSTSFSSGVPLSFLSLRPSGVLVAHRSRRTRIASAFSAVIFTVGSLLLNVCALGTPLDELFCPIRLLPLLVGQLPHNLSLGCSLLGSFPEAPTQRSSSLSPYPKEGRTPTPQNFQVAPRCLTSF